MQISFHGAARTVTGSKHLVKTDGGTRILLDCGMFQGLGPQTLDLNQDFGFDPKEIDIVVLSHAHIDHSGLLPKLAKEGYDGKIYCTQATQALVEVLLRDSAYIQEMDVRHANKQKAAKGKAPVKALYNIYDAAAVIALLQPAGYNNWIQIAEDVQLMYLEAGHILGSATVHLKITEGGKEQILTFSGDIGRYNDDILMMPATFPQSDIIIMESTYGDKLHKRFKPSVEMLYECIIKTCIHQKGKLIIPAFSVGRTQELLYALNSLELENRLPNVKYFVDSPMSVEVTELTKQYPELFNKEVQNIMVRDKDPFDFKGLRMVEDVAESKSLNFLKEPCVIISASGMAEAGRVKHHIKNNIGDPSSTILLVGYATPDSLSGRLMAGNKEVGIYGTRYRVEASVARIESLSAHGDYNDLCTWLSCQDPHLVKRLFLVHGEYEVQQTFAKRLEEKGYTVEIPALHSSYTQRKRY